MSRLEQKCFVASASLHGAMIAVLLFGSLLFTNRDKIPDMGPVVDFVNAKVTDRLVNSGGNPNGTPTPPPPAPAPVQPKAEQLPPPPAPPQPEPPKPEPPKPEPVTKKAEPEPEPEPIKKPEPKVKDTAKKPDPKETLKEKGDLPVRAVTKKDPKKDKDLAQKDNSTNRPAISTTLVKRTVDKAAIERAEKAQAEAAAREAQRIRQQAVARAERQYAKDMAEYAAARQSIGAQVGGIIGGVGKELTHSTVVEPLGPGGEAYVHYGTFVREVYDRAWRIGQDLSDNDAVALARVTIRRDGSVSSAVIHRRSGNPVLDKSVQRALDDVRNIGRSFPSGAKEAERTFTIEFNLKTRRAVG